MYTDYVMIDYENVQQVDWKPFRGLKKKVVVFVGHTQPNIRYELVVEIHRHGEHAEYVKISGNGKNTLDYHIALEIGMLCCEHPDARFHIVSNDKGYEALADHLRKKHGVEVNVHRQEPETPPPAKKSDEPPVTQQPATPKPAVVPKATSTTTPQKAKTTDERAQYVIGLLKPKKSARPRTRKTLTNHVSSLFQKKLVNGNIDAIIEAMKKRGFIAIDDNGKVTYRS